MKGKVVGIGGVFFESNSPDEIKDWYAENLGLSTNKYGALFQFKKHSDNSSAFLQWSAMKKPVDYFTPSTVPFMINYRVTNLEDLLQTLKKKGISQIGETEVFEYGKFAWILDPEGRKIELWEPVDSAFEGEFNKDAITE